MSHVGRQRDELAGLFPSRPLCSSSVHLMLGVPERKWRRQVLSGNCRRRILLGFWGSDTLSSIEGTWKGPCCLSQLPPLPPDTYLRPIPVIQQRSCLVQEDSSPSHEHLRCALLLSPLLCAVSSVGLYLTSLEE